LGENHVIELADEPAVIEKKLKKAITASEGGDSAPGAKNLLGLFREFGDKTIHRQFVQEEEQGTIRYGDLKKELAGYISEYFYEFRKKREKMLIDKMDIVEKLAKGSESAKIKARMTLDEVKKNIGLN